ncbi:MAG: S8 family serine peptidase [Chloroflexi bacterium]|nr:S8 family serine peptidase [Chloroflexota bacterium]MBU1750565.1 S8 family serine peptidase [Chloroflexota bacterium]
MRPLLALCGILALLLAGLPGPPAAAASGEHVTVIIILREQARLDMAPGLSRADRLQRVVQTLQAQAARSRHPLEPLLANWQADGRISRVVPLWIINGLAITATPAVIRELSVHPAVQRIAPNVTIPAPSSLSAPASSPGSGNAPNLDVVNAPALWAWGVRGQGIVVANMDTGVYLNHPDLVAQWRGGTNSWYDPYGEHPAAPTDLNGHGTGTMGVMVGRDASGTAVGVAPDAQWIAVKVFDDRNQATAVAIHQGFQWLLDPDGDPTTPDAPHVVNCSWDMDAPGCDLAFQTDLQALRAAGIVPVFAAGNLGPATETSVSPANYAEALAVGATNNVDALYAESSRGPSACDEAIFPDLVAPGVSILTTERYGLYMQMTGTSAAAPHAAGGLALLLSAFPGLTVAEQEATLLTTVVDRGPAGPDNGYGHGRLDLLAAFQQLSGGWPYRIHLPVVARP